jgi:hypothetical protein
LSATCAASTRTSPHSPTRLSNGLRKETMMRPSRSRPPPRAAVAGGDRRRRLACCRRAKPATGRAELRCR